MPASQIELNIQHCARCGQDHADLIFFEFFHPCGKYSHWATCPVTKEPVMMWTEPDDPEVK